MSRTRRTAALAAMTVTGTLLAGCAGGPGGGGGKISDGKVVLAVLNDQSGVYSDISGKATIQSVNLAIADYKAKYGSKAVAKDIEVMPSRWRSSSTATRSPSPIRAASGCATTRSCC